MTGLYLLPGSLLMLFAGPCAGILGRRVGSKWPLAIGMAPVALLDGHARALHDEPWQVVVAMAGLSVGVGFSFAAMAALITGGGRPDRDRDRDRHQHRHATRRSVIGAQVGPRSSPRRPSTAPPSRPRAPVDAFLAGGRRRRRAVIAVFVTPVRRRRRAELAMEPG